MYPVFEYRIGQGVDGAWVAWKIRDLYIKKTGLATIAPPNASKHSVGSTTSISRSAYEAPFLLVISKPAMDQFEVESTDRKFFSIVTEAGYSCWIKDHIRLDLRLGFDALAGISTSDLNTYLDPALPSEVLLNCTQFRGIIGVDSAALASADVPSLSLMNLIKMDDRRRDFMIDYLCSFDSEIPISFPSSWGEVESWLSNFP
jgi:hypothetical protein